MPLTQQYLLDLVVPPIVTCIWWLLSRGTTTVFQGGKVSGRTKTWLSKGLVVVLVGTYVIMFGITTYIHLAK